MILFLLPAPSCLQWYTKSLKQAIFSLPLCLINNPCFKEKSEAADYYMYIHLALRICNQINFVILL